MAVFIHQDVLAGGFLEKAHHAHVFAHAALEHDGALDALALAHIVEVVRHHGLAETCDDVLAAVAHLGLVDQVGLGEHGAAGGDGGGGFALEGDAAEFLHLHAQAVGLAGEEGTGACGAEGVHGVVHHHAVFQQDDLAVLAADLENSAHVRVQRGGAHGVGRDLVFNHGRAHHRADEPAGAASGAHGDHLIVVLVEFCLQQFQKTPDGLDGVALGPDVFAGEEIVVVIDDDALGGDGADIDAEIQSFHIRVACLACRELLFTVFQQVGLLQTVLFNIDS